MLYNNPPSINDRTCALCGTEHFSHKEAPVFIGTMSWDSLRPYNFERTTLFIPICRECILSFTEEEVEKLIISGLFKLRYKLRKQDETYDDILLPLEIK